MFDSLTAAVDEIDVPAEGSALAELLALRDRLSAKIASALGAFDRDDGWALDHEASLASWLRRHGGMTGRAAAALSRQAKLLDQLPLVSAMYADGSLSGAQVDAITANLSERTVDLFASHEDEVVPALAPLPSVDVAAAMRAWRQRAEALLDSDAPAEAVRELNASTTLDGRVEGRFSLDAEGGALLRTVLRFAETRDAGSEERTPARRRADALLDVLQHYLDHQSGRAGGRHRPHVNVVLTLDDLEQRRGGRFDDGGVVPATTVERLLCDCNLHRFLTDGAGTILDYGRATRTAPVNLFNALLVRDQRCRDEGCDVPGDRCDVHHVVPWELGGETSPDNCVLKCTRHHHLHHQPGWHDKLLPDGTYVVTDPSGRTRTTRPPGALELAVTA